MKEKKVIYAIAGDMLRGSIIDSEYKGLSTIEVMNLLTHIGFEEDKKLAAELEKEPRLVIHSGDQ